MKIKEMRTLPEDEVASEIEKARAKIFKMRFQGKGESVENPGSLRTLRRQIAQLMTILQERRLGMAKPAGATTSAGASGGDGPSKDRGGEA